MTLYPAARALDFSRLSRMFYAHHFRIKGLATWHPHAVSPMSLYWNVCVHSRCSSGAERHCGMVIVSCAWLKPGLTRHCRSAGERTAIPLTEKSGWARHGTSRTSRGCQSV